MTSLPMPQDPEFNINTATNTFYKALGDRVASGQMTLDQARAAQAEMRALQLNPAAANRQTATDIAQRHLQVGKYSPSQPQGGLTAIAPQPIPMQPPMPDRPADFGIPLWMRLGPGPERDVDYAQYMKAQRGEMQPKGIGGMPPSNMLANLGQMLSGQRPTQPTNTGNGMLVMPAIPQPYQQGPMAQPHIYNPVNTTTERDLRGPRGMGGMRNMFGVNPNDLAAMGGILPKLAEQFRNAQGMAKPYTSVPRQLTQEEILGITSMPQRPQGVGMAPQMPMKPQGLTLSNVPQQQRLTLSNVPQQGVVPQPMSAPQGMAMGGLMEKYYGGGMC